MEGIRAIVDAHGVMDISKQFDNSPVCSGLRRQAQSILTDSCPVGWPVNASPIKRIFPADEAEQFLFGHAGSCLGKFEGRICAYRGQGDRQ